ncbi:hypothetical protein [Marinicella meishanensis]|uniref:hypothetical protein n=1 Tax=Marinicella meishanensis TaxID=2873263 RepID=UPI001CBE6E32|nr:hypothetical protein [Marinicella sp. NBU2979]
MSEPISIGRIFELTNNTFKDHFGYLAGLAALFIGLAFVVGLLGGYLALLFGPALFFVIMVLMLIVYAKLAIMVHRLVLLDEKGLEHLLQWRLVEVQFIGWIVAVLLSLAAVIFVLFKIAPPMAPAAGVGGGSAVWLFLLALIIMGIVFSRLAMVFPATAAGHRLSLSESFEMTRHHKFFVFFLVVLVPYITNRIFQQINTESLALMLLVELISVLVIIFEVALLSHAYEALRGGADDEPPGDQAEADEPNELVG